MKKKESLGLKFSTRHASGILILRQEGQIPIENFCKLLVSQIQTAEEGFEEKVSNSQKKYHAVTSFQESSNSSIWDELKFVRVNLIALSCQGQIKRKRTVKRQNVIYRGYKARQWQTERKEQLYPIGDKDRTNLNTKMQPDKHTYI